MFKMKRMTWMIGCALALSGCASSFQDKSASLADIEIKPVMNIRHANQSPKIMYLLGRYYQGKIDYHKAIAAYEKALAGKPDYVEVHNSLGIIYSIQGRHELALQHFHKAIEISPAETYLYNNLGYAYLTQGKEAEAAQSLEKALLLDSENKRARHNLAITYERIGLSDEAALLRMALVNTSSPEALEAHDETQATVTKQAVSESRTNNKPESRFTQLPDAHEYKAKSKGPAAVAEQALGSTVAELSGNKDIRIEISNGNGVTGMAGRVSAFFQQHGLAKARLTNHQAFNQNQTEIYYRSGNFQQAYQINRILPKQVKMVESKDLRSDIQIKVLLGQDYSQEIAHFEKKDSVRISQGSEQTATKLAAKESL